MYSGGNVGTTSLNSVALNSQVFFLPVVFFFPLPIIVCRTLQEKAKVFYIKTTSLCLFLYYSLRIVYMDTAGKNNIKSTALSFSKS